MFPSMIRSMNKVVLENFSFYEPSAEAKVTFTEIEKDTNIPPHIHKKDVCNFLARGKLQITFGAKEVLIEKGSWFEIKKGEQHSIMCLEESELIEVWIEGFDE